MNLENLAEKYKLVKEQLNRDFNQQVEAIIEVAERLVLVNNNLNILSERSEKRLKEIEEKTEKLKLKISVITKDLRDVDDRIRDLE
jgi:archaellum component FlaC